jgi:hypothetical protein
MEREPAQPPSDIEVAKLATELGVYCCGEVSGAEADGVAFLRHPP